MAACRHNGFDDARVAVAHAVYGNAGHEVQVLFAVGIPDACKATAHEEYILAAIGLKYGFRFPFLQIIFIGHKINSCFIAYCWQIGDSFESGD